MVSTSHCSAADLVQRFKAGHTRNRYCDAGKFLTEQQLPNERRDNQQRQSGDGFANGGENQHLFIGPFSLSWKLLALRCFNRIGLL